MADPRLSRSPPAPVLVAFDPPVAQRRVTVALRLLLAAPHLAALCVVGLLALMVAVVGWGAALVSGRLPRRAAEFLSGVLRFQTRLWAYLFLLTDVYPPFSLHDAAYPVRLTTQAGRLNRAAVAFRLLLAVPAMVVAATVTYATGTAVLVVTWFVVLVTGRLPSSLHGIFAAFVRYEARLHGYLTMVTSQYPWGLLGDAGADAPTPDGRSEGPGRGPVWQPAPPSPVDDPYWRVVLTSRAKNLVVVFLVLAVASVVTVNVTTTVSRIQQLNADDAAGTQLQSAYLSLSGVVIDYQADVTSCRNTPQTLSCLTGAAQMVSGAFTVFVHRLAVSPVPGPAMAALGALESDAAQAEQVFAQVSASTTSARYQLALQSSSLPQLLSHFDRDYQALGALLNPSP